MNLLNNPGIQSDIDLPAKGKENIIINEIENFVNDKPKSNNRYRNIVIIISFILSLFFAYSLYLSSYNLFENKSEITIINVFNDIKDSNINSVEVNNNRLNIILNYDQSNKIYQDYDLYDSKYSYVGLLINNSVSQIYIRDVYRASSSVDFYELFSIISYIDDINIEKDIINNNLIIIGDYSDIFKIFKAINNYRFNFKLELIKSTSLNKYYQLTILND
tara:strand:- start:576 stop:1232 length:657 start_codon:yes stop_codon:yes gene_type:complete